MKNIFRIILLVVVILFASCKGTTDSGSTGNDSTNNENSSGDATPQGQVVAPVFTTKTSEVAFTIPITLESETEDATIYYTINGDDPTDSSANGKSIDISSYSNSVTIKAMAVKNGMINSDVTSAVYTQSTVATPVFSRESGKVLMGKTTLTVEVDTVDAKIKYAFGSDDPLDGNDYDSGIELDFSTDGEVKTIRVIATKDGYINSTVNEITLTAKTMQMHPITGETFTMGNPDEENADASDGYNEYPSREVTLDSFIIGTHEVTQWQWESVMGTWPRIDPVDTKYGSTDNHPAYHITWYDAIDFCNELSIQQGLTPYYTISKTDENDVTKWGVKFNEDGKNGYRLPTEAEWEFAAGGGKENRTTYAGTDNGEPTGENALTNYAWYSQNANKKIYEVGTAGRSNALGLYDMNGNVWEWCWDGVAKYTEGPVTNPAVTPSGKTRIVRGGSWNDDAERLRVVERGVATATSDYATIGFRVARNGS